MAETATSVTSALQQQVAQAIADAGGWIGFERFMALALYTPGLGYYARGQAVFGHGLPARPGGDFVTAPELGPWFGACLATQLREALHATGTDAVWEFGAGSGALAGQLLDALGDALRRYHIVDLSGGLRAQQQAALARHAHKLQWHDALPDALQGVVVGNELLDAMPVALLQRLGGRWHERGVAVDAKGRLRWEDRPTAKRPPEEPDGPHDYLTELHAQAEAFVRTLGERLVRGAAFFIDYGFPAAEYYHPQRHMGTLVCHRAHRVDGAPLADLGEKDITAHVNFTAIALAAQELEPPLELLGYTTQARFLFNCGITEHLKDATPAERALALKLVTEHEMGELFKVIGFVRGAPAWDALGFRQGDRSHTL